MNILLCIGGYYPHMSPNGRMAMNIAEVMKARHTVIILSRKNHTGLSGYSTVDGLPVYRIGDFNRMMYSFLNEKISASRSKASVCVFKALFFLRRAIFAIPRLLRKTSVSKYYLRKIVKAIGRIDERYRLDALIAFSAPHEEVFACVEYHKKSKRKPELILYQMDAFSNSATLYMCGLDRARKERNNLRLELDALARCKNLFVLPPLYSHYTQDIFKPYIGKIVVTEHPLLKPVRGDSDEKPACGKLRVVYAGAFYKGLREPTYLLEMLYRNIESMDCIALDIYSFGGCRDILAEYRKKMPDTVFDHGRVSSDAIAGILASADILLSVGNNCTDGFPSKVFEYISYKKPIVHLYYTDADAYLEYLKRYPYALCLKMDMDSIESNGIRFRDFCMENKGRLIDDKAILDAFGNCTPEYVCGQLLEAVERCV